MQGWNKFHQISYWWGHDSDPGTITPRLILLTNKWTYSFSSPLTYYPSNLSSNVPSLEVFLDCFHHHCKHAELPFKFSSLCLSQLVILYYLCIYLINSCLFHASWRQRWQGLGLLCVPYVLHPAWRLTQNKWSVALLDECMNPASFVSLIVLLLDSLVFALNFLFNSLFGGLSGFQLKQVLSSMGHH